MGSLLKFKKIGLISNTKHFLLIIAGGYEKERERERDRCVEKERLGKKSTSSKSIIPSYRTLPNVIYRLSDKVIFLYFSLSTMFVGKSGSLSVDSYLSTIVNTIRR